MRASKEQTQQEALSRAIGGQALTNWPAIFAGFTAKGIPESDIRPRENVFTYHAWRALGRQVRRGEHAVKVVTFVSTGGRDRTDGEDDTDAERPAKRRGGSRPWSATVFHVSQTDPVPAGHLPAATGDEVRLPLLASERPSWSFTHYPGSPDARETRSTLPRASAPPAPTSR